MPQSHHCPWRNFPVTLMASVCSAKTSHLLPTTLLDWDCPDCSHLEPDHVAAPAPPPGDLISAIRAIQSDTSLTEEEKAKKRQELVGGSSKPSGDRKQPFEEGEEHCRSMLRFRFSDDF